ncbi:MAG: FeoB-associated Cys-rich membrane protein [Thermodesulfovibrio sp.]
MSITDILLAVAILGGAVYILYRSICRKKGHCSGCSGLCGKEKDNFLL